MFVRYSVRCYRSGTAVRAGELAFFMAVSISTLRRLSLTHFGDPPAKVLRRLRQHHAERLLASGRVRVASVAELAGFGTARTLFRSFKKATGASPRDVHPIGGEAR